ncbi:ABC transporter ATP-binding protein [Microbacteriaceae bacterium K1510]|nr:ABC transporter ATP-binding protein [Microbacteriaceae bacterium K1510]
MTAPGLEVKGLRKIYANVEGVGGGIREANFHLPPGTFFTLLGPSGCGKTTTLRCVAGLERPDVGIVQVGQATFFDSVRHIDVPLNRRNIGMVFQSYAIWPHMTVMENVSFPLRVAKDRRYSREEIDTMSRKALATVDLEGFADRSATRLSGGQQQRVALARAIVREPKLLLLDEPLSNLDAALRESMRKELKRLQRQIGITTVYVTHDQAEALEMSDQIAVLNAGEVVQIDTPDGIYFRPRNRFVAGFVGSTNIFDGTAQETVGQGGMVPVRFKTGEVIRGKTNRRVTAGDGVVISVRPESIRLSAMSTSDDGASNRFRGQVESRGFVGNLNRYDVRCGSHLIVANTGPRTAIAQGEAVSIAFDPEDAIILADDKAA